MIFIRYYFFCLLCPYWASVRYIECKQCHTQKRIRFTSTHNSGEQSKQEYYNNHCMDTRSPRVCVCFLIACENYVFTTNSILPQWEIFKKTKNTHFFIAVISRMISCRSFYHNNSIGWRSECHNSMGFLSFWSWNYLINFMAHVLSGDKLLYYLLQKNIHHYQIARNWDFRRMLRTCKLHEMFVSFYFLWKSLWLQVILHCKAAANGF